MADSGRKKEVYPQRMVLKSFKTQRQDTQAIKTFAEYLGREALLSDLTDQSVAGWMAWLLRTKNLVPQSVNASRHRMLCMWRFLARKRFAAEFPEVGMLAEPQPVPTAWTQEQMCKLFAACRAWTGPDFGGVNGAGWFLALTHIAYDTGMRAAELWALQWDWLDWETGDLVVPAVVRKGHRQGMVYSLHADTLAILKTITEPQRELILPMDRDKARFYSRFNTLLESAGLPHDRRSKLHRLRRTCASWLESVLPGSATAALGHSSRRVTEKYLDVRITKRTKPSDLLPRPEAGRGEVA
ncbi:MAG: tyrosine-type recombinase/integrase [Planctomycetes bacterium]|nr:tyrosine-type recombinase/integrase [Planctomycetota bacterium]